MRGGHLYQRISDQPNTFTVLSSSNLLTADSSDRFFSAALGSIDRDYRIAFMNVSLSDVTDPDTLQTSELFRTPINDRWLKCECVDDAFPILGNYLHFMLSPFEANHKRKTTIILLCL